MLVVGTNQPAYRTLLSRVATVSAEAAELRPLEKLPILQNRFGRIAGGFWTNVGKRPGGKHQEALALLSGEALDLLQHSRSVLQ